MKKCFIVITAFLILFLSSCTYSNNDKIEDMLSRIPSVFEAAPQIPDSDNGFQKLYKKYAELNAVNFVSAEKEMNNILNTKYSYGVSAYNMSNGLSDTASMFFDDDSADRIGLYFKLLGYSKREYAEEENTAIFICEKDECSYKYEVVYDEKALGFGITVYKDDTVYEVFECSVNEDDLTKVYYDGNIKRIIISKSDSDKNVSIKWYDTEYSRDIDFAKLEETGFVKYENGTLTGS